ncbi:MAG TPA: hypothetical protein VFZ08_11390, partial [Terriglobia bacterium]|nr:hypothetical protein [Terriglobia bacterium]
VHILVFSLGAKAKPSRPARTGCVGSKLPEGQSPSGRQAAKPQVAPAILKPNLDKHGLWPPVFIA